MDVIPNQDEPTEAASLFRTMPAAETTPPLQGEPTFRVSSPAQPLNDISALQARLAAAGVKPDRIASPDLPGQLEQAKSIKIDTIICSVLDTDPTVGLNAAVADSCHGDMAAGIALLAKLSGAERVWVAADPDKSSEWFEQLKSKLQIPGLRLIPLRGDYPQTDPTLMLFTLLQRRLVPGKLPSSKGVLLVDAVAAVAVGRCLLTDSPVLQTPLAVRDHFQRRTHLLNVPMHVSLADVLAFLEIRATDAVFRAGDFLRDLWITPQTILGNGELVIHPTASHLDANPDPCIHCGWCLEACPTRIHPAGLLDAAQQKNARMAKRFGIDACIECGICSYVCPTRLPLLTAIRTLRKI
jgi:electron transport complex protein RnfC